MSAPALDPDVRPPMPDPGKRPELRWLPVDRLEVDHRYQRTLDSRRSQALIARIAAAFRWSKFQAILAAPKDGGADGTESWLVLDGQHRLEAARRVKLGEVPAVVVEALSLAEQAEAFAGANMDRVSVNQFALYHARLVAGDAAAVRVDALCGEAGIVIPRYPIPADKLKPGQTIALATIARLPGLVGDAAARLALRAIGGANAQRAGALRAPLLLAVAKLIGDEAPAARARRGAAIQEFLARTTPEELGVRVAKHRARYAVRREADAYAVVIGTAIATAKPVRNVRIPERAAAADPEPKPPEPAACDGVDGAGSSSEANARQSAAADRHPSGPAPANTTGRAATRTGAVPTDDDEVAAFIAERGVTHCPPAYAGPTEHGKPLPEIARIDEVRPLHYAVKTRPGERGTRGKWTRAVA